MSILVVFVILTVVGVVTAGNWKHNEISIEELDRIARMSDGPNELETFKTEILDPFLRVRVSGTEANRLVREHVKKNMAALKWHVEEDSFTASTPVGDKQFVNLVAVYNQSAPHRLTLACHYDSKLMTNAEFIGATDSAVPCALMIDVARKLDAVLAANTNHKATLQFIFFDGEEAFVSWTRTDSLYGSRHLASKLHETRLARETKTLLEAIDVMVLLDLIGSVDTRFANWFSNTFEHYKQFQHIENKLCRLQLLNSSEPNHYFTANMYQSMEFTGGIQDDHGPFRELGVPILHLISYPFPTVWHQPTDNESALHYPTINDINKVLRVFVVKYLGLNVF